MSTVLFALAILSLILIPLAPKLVRLRIRFLRWLHWNWAVNLLEKHFDGRVVSFRIITIRDRSGFIICRLGKFSRLINASDCRQRWLFTFIRRLNYDCIRFHFEFILCQRTSVAEGFILTDCQKISFWCRCRSTLWAAWRQSICASLRFNP